MVVPPGSAAGAAPGDGRWLTPWPAPGRLVTLYTNGFRPDRQRPGPGTPRLPARPPAAQHIEPGLAGQPPDQGCAGQHAGGEAAAAGCEVAGGSGPELTEPFDLVVLAGSWSVVRQLRSMPEPWYNVPNDR